MGLNASEIYRRNFTDDRSLPGQANVVIIKEVVEYVDHFVRINRQITAREIAKEMFTSKGNVPTILHERFLYRKICMQWGPKHSTEEQKIHLMSLSMQYLMQYHGMESQFLLRIIAADETWCHHFDSATKSLNMEGRHSSSPRPKKAHSSIRAGKIVLTGFINVDGPLLLE
ncbi:jerky protein [Trichonephila inaurata madagascariensis]|uniref:Jerky protein n=1 Tax=Trichonephila inaurata madagascariensis TaxID=2747483 RepID=A0A8X6J3P9_9ARAC|nr:jerky protein [Trichonephila inaurata madagascariensis]